MIDLGTCLEKSMLRLLTLCLIVSVTGQPSATADDGTHWSFQMLRPVNVPTVQSGAQVQTPVDAFLLRRLEEQSLSFSPDANAETFLRRVHLDLTGLPPSPDTQTSFLQDPSPDAIERLVDRLLQSPQFGERWGRHWLDVVGYTDTVGFDIDPNLVLIPKGKWKYRDYVVDSLNGDKPYDEFVREQLAGDEMVDWRNAERFTDDIREKLIATGFLRTASDFTHEPESDIPLNYYAVLHDTVEIVGNSLLGLTLQCSRCHDHKFDPFTQQEYYQLMACLTPAYNPQNWRPVYPWKPEIRHRGLPDVSPAEQKAISNHNRPIDEQIAALEKQLKEIPKDQTARRQPIEQKVAALKSSKKSFGYIQALYDVGPQPVTKLLERGSYETPGESVLPGVLAPLTSAESSFEAISIELPDETASTGQRTKLARWLTKPQTPSSALLARVIVNRIWQHFFERGLVESAGNFGLEGTPPTHPELLEWLAGELVRNEWRLKPIIRLIVTSTAYRQSSSESASPRGARAIKADPENRLLWRMPLRRLDSEAIRDSLLAVSGTLDTTMSGEPVVLRTEVDGRVRADPGKLPWPGAASRRSIYLATRRAYNESLLTAFDQPQIATTCSTRNPSAVVSQSLAMLNSGFVLEQAGHLADRVIAEVHLVPDRQVELAWRFVLARSPNDDEAASSLSFLQRQAGRFQMASGTKLDKHAVQKAALTQLCHMLLNTSEFLYAE